MMMMMMMMMTRARVENRSRMWISNQRMQGNTTKAHDTEHVLSTRNRALRSDNQLHSISRLYLC
jgi:hypothetical protein